MATKIIDNPGEYGFPQHITLRVSDGIAAPYEVTDADTGVQIEHVVAVDVHIGRIEMRVEVIVDRMARLPDGDALFERLIYPLKDITLASF